jgi:hypothetical protein
MTAGGVAASSAAISSTCRPAPRKEHRMASALTFELRRADGTPADPPRLTTAAPTWRPGDTIPLGRRTLRVVEVLEGNVEHRTVLVVEDVAE